MLANYQSAFFYLPRVLYAFLDVHLAGTIYFLLKVWLTGLTAYLYGRGIRLSIGSSYFLSFGWMLSSMNLFWLFWCSSDVATWLPIQLLGIEVLLRGRKRSGFLLIAGSAVFMLLAGHPETLSTMALGAGIYFLLRVIVASWSAPAAMLRLAGTALAAWVLALSISAVQIVPFLEYLRNSSTLIERQSERSAAHKPYDPELLVCLWCPRYFGVNLPGSNFLWCNAHKNSNFTSAYYPGIGAWLGLTLLLSPRAWPRRHAVRISCLMAAGLLFFLAAFAFPITRCLYSLPLLRTVWRIWFFPFAGFAMVAIAAMMLDHWCSSPGRLAYALPAIGSIGLVIGTLWANYYLSHWTGFPDATRQFVEHQLLVTSLTAAVGALILLLPVLRARPPISFTVLAIFVATDLLIAGRGVHPTAPRSVLCVQTRLMDWLRSTTDSGRVISVSGKTLAPLISEGILPYFGIEELSGHDGLCPIPIARFFSRTKVPDRSRLFSIRYVLRKAGSGAEIPPDAKLSQELVQTIDGYDIWEQTNAWPRARLIPAAKVVPDVDALFDIFNSASFDPANTVLLESPPPLPLPEQSSEDAGTAQVVERTTNTVTVQADAKQRSVLVLTDQYFPGWKATIDTQSSEVFPVYSAFRGVVVEPGRHTIVFRYAPLSFRIGLALSTTTLLISAAISCLMLRGLSLRRRRSDSVEQAWAKPEGQLGAPL